MADTLFVGDLAYSSWSLRGWLLFDAFGLTVSLVRAPMFTPGFAETIRGFAPSRTVPAARIDGVDGAVWDSLAIAETLAERPDAGHWPADAAARAAARSLSAEMHAGFRALRAECPMNLRHAYDGFAPSEAVRGEVARVEALWGWARARFGDGGPWLFGARYGAVDAFFAPVATRIATYGLEVGPEAAAYVATHLAHPAMRRGRAMALAEDRVLERYEMDLAARPYPAPPPRPARAVAGVTAENAACPYSGKPVDPGAVAEIDGRAIGFCNRFCRDKTVADPEAWPAAKALLAAPQPG